MSTDQHSTVREMICMSFRKALVTHPWTASISLILNSSKTLVWWVGLCVRMRDACDFVQAFTALALSTMYPRTDSDASRV